MYTVKFLHGGTIHLHLCCSITSLTNVHSIFQARSLALLYCMLQIGIASLTECHIVYYTLANSTFLMCNSYAYLCKMN